MIDESMPKRNDDGLLRAYTGLTIPHSGWRAE
jgi:hypothetical protein